MILPVLEELRDRSATLSAAEGSAYTELYEGNRFLAEGFGGLTADQIDALSDEHQRRIIESLVSKIAGTPSQSAGKQSVSVEFRVGVGGQVESDGSGHDQRPCSVAGEQQPPGASTPSVLEGDHGKKHCGSRGLSAAYLDQSVTVE